jgi:hypothetical protein
MNLGNDLSFLIVFTRMLPASPICLVALGCAARLHAVEVGACGAIRCLGWLSKGWLSLTCAPLEFSITHGPARDFNENCGQVTEIVNPAIVFVVYKFYGV